MAHTDLTQVSADEHVIREVKRHPIGIVGILIFGALAALAVMFGMYFLISNADKVSVENFKGAVGSVGTFLVFLIATLTFVGIILYRANKLTLTNENLIQVLQKGLISRQVSQLNIGNVQDV